MKHITQALMYVSQAVGILNAIRTAAVIAMQQGGSFSALKNGKKMAIRALMEGRAQVDLAIRALNDGKDVVIDEDDDGGAPLTPEELAGAIADDADVTKSKKQLDQEKKDREKLAKDMKKVKPNPVVKAKPSVKIKPTIRP